MNVSYKKPNRRTGRDPVTYRTGNSPVPEKNIPVSPFGTSNRTSRINFAKI